MGEPIRNNIVLRKSSVEPQKSRRANDFEVQIMKYKNVVHKWQNKEFGKLSSIIPILFYQGLDNWDPDKQ